MPDETATLSKTRLAHLERLGEELSERGFVVRMSQPRGGPPSLHVVNPNASALAENILADDGDDGWWYMWSWAERIAAAEQVGKVAERVARVLAAVGN
jgi:hypothetical protein